jgi:23S rRNA (uracil1939-C5)-methyltransferase
MKRAKSSAVTALEATITELAPGGDGVAIAEIGGERRAVFVRGVSTGDRVRLEVDASRRPARGRVVELVAAGADRVEAACAWADRCGGCNWMHVSLEAQRRAHVAHVRAALPAVPEGWRAIDIATHAADGDALAYRVRARVHARASGGRAIVGMNESSTNEPVEVETCAVLTRELEAARRAIAPLLEGAHGRGDAQIAMGRAKDGATRPVLDLTWSGMLAAECYARLERAVAAGDFAGARVVCGEATRASVIGDPTPWMAGADGAPLRLAAGGFGQASERTNALLARRVAELAASTAPASATDAAPHRVVELYAGAGNLTVMLAGLRVDLTAVESSRDGCDAARANLAARGLVAKIVEADAASYAWSPATRLVVLDPPRTGAREVAASLARTPVRHVIYVSCDPQTLGRDLALLAELYAPTSIDTFEMFPHTSHVETVVALERRRGSKKKEGA